MRVLMDTDVLADVALAREPFCGPARMVLEWLDSGPHRPLIALHSVSNLYYILRKQNGDEAARTFLGGLCERCEIPAIENAGVADALKSPQKDFEDALQVSAALAGRADCIVTRNLGNYAKSPVDVTSPDRFAAQHIPEAS